MGKEESKKFKRGDKVYVELTDEQMHTLCRKSKKAIGTLEAYFSFGDRWNIWIEGTSKSFIGRAEKDLIKI